MNTLLSLWHTIVAAVAHVGYVKFLILVIASVILWRIHPVLGILGVLFTFAILLGFF